MDAITIPLNTGKAPIKVRWLDINKGDKEMPEYRPRLVAKEIKRDSREDLFAAAPPLEAKKILFQKAVNKNARRRRAGRRGIKIMLIDVKKAHLNGVVKEGENAYIELPGEAGRRGMCGRLKRWLYGMRPAIP